MFSPTLIWHCARYGGQRERDASTQESVIINYSAIRTRESGRGSIKLEMQSPGDLLLPLSHQLRFKTT